MKKKLDRLLDILVIVWILMSLMTGALACLILCAKMVVWIAK